MGTYTLQEAYELDVGDKRLLRDDFTKDIVILRDLVTQAFLLTAEQRWISKTLDEAARPKVTRSDSSLSHQSVERSRPRRREDPSSGRGASIPTTVRANSDSDSSQPPPRRASWQEKTRQIHHRMYHASERDYSDSPLFPPPASSSVETPCHR